MRYTSRWAGALTCVAMASILVALALMLAACAQDPTAGGQNPAAGQQSPSASATSGSPTRVATPAPPPTPAPPAATTVPVPPMRTISVARSGGFAGVMQLTEIAPDGSWVFTNKRTGKVERGRLTEAQRERLARLVADPRLVQEARRSPPPYTCADAFVYKISVGDLSYRYEQCGGTGHYPATSAVLSLVLSVTSM